MGKTRYGPISIYKSIIEKRPIHLFNNGNMIRDFTYIDDIVRGIYKVFMKPAKPDKI